MRYHHIGIPTTTVRAGEEYLERFKCHCTDHASNAFGIQWMRFEPECTLPDLVKTVPHIAFQVDNLEEAIAGHNLLIEPNSPSAGVMVAFVIVDDAPVEFLQFTQAK